MSLIIVTGMSGAGKSTAINALEDIGFFCADNVPPPLLDRFALLNARSKKGQDRMAIVVDARAGELFDEFGSALDRLSAAGVEFTLLFLDADYSVLIDRYKEGRRRHPLIGDETAGLPEAIAKERILLSKARARADIIIDTSRLAPAVLKSRISQLFCDTPDSKMTIECISFGFKNGLPREADLVFDVRCLPNPYYVPDLKNLTGLDEAVREYIMRFDSSKGMFERIVDFLEFSVPFYESEGKSHLVIAFGCTGGHHRSVTFAKLIGEHLQKTHSGTVIVHRDLEKR
ncbi:MAG: RNase adapter RapZ [Oscillospiraceae bacterium]|nr:RNase adapter RapZ [Oscillospiraceae bacterium]